MRKCRAEESCGSPVKDDTRRVIDTIIAVDTGTAIYLTLILAIDDKNGGKGGRIKYPGKPAA